MSEKQKKSISHERGIKGYLDPILKNKLPELMSVTGFNKSEIVNNGVRALMEQKNIIPVKNR